MGRHSLAGRLLQSARSRALSRGLPFRLTIDDIVIPSHCPVLGLPLKEGSGDFSPSVDRLIPELGYVPGNIAVISARANRIKSDASPHELSKVAAWAAYSATLYHYGDVACSPKPHQSKRP